MYRESNFGTKMLLHFSMADTVTPTAGETGTETASRRAPRRKPDAPAKAQAASRRNRMVQLAILAVAAVITIDAVVGEKGLLETFRARKRHAEQVRVITAYKHENARLRDYGRRLKEDPATIEEFARRNLGLVKPGEILVIVRDAEKR